MNTTFSIRAFWFSSRISAGQQRTLMCLFFYYFFKFLHFLYGPADEVNLDEPREFLVHEDFNHIIDLR